MTGDLTIDNPVVGPLGEVSGLLLSWATGFGYGTISMNPSSYEGGEHGEMTGAN
jgi:hypothetical protein